MKATCPACGYVHASNDARAVGRFSGSPSYVAAHGGPLRATRAEAESDECAWRQQRTRERDSGPVQVARPPTERAPAVPKEPLPPFPAAAFEDAARAKAWHDFLTQVRLSLMVWQIDGEVRDRCEHVLTWINRCHDELAFGGAS